MRDDLKLRLFIGEAVTISELPKEAKLQLLKFIQNEASDAQIKALIMDGEVLRLDHFSEQIVNDRWDALNAESKLVGSVKKMMIKAKQRKNPLGLTKSAELRGLKMTKTQLQKRKAYLIAKKKGDKTVRRVRPVSIGLKKY